MSIFFGGFIVSQDEFRAPAGWYPDPLGHPQLRWWNSNGWTEQVSAAPEPVIVQQQRYTWKEEEPQVIPVQPRVAQAPTPPRTPVSSTLQELEAPRAQTKIEEPASFDNWQALQVAPAAPSAPVAPAAISMPAAITTPPPAPAAPTPPPYWDADDDSVPVPSVRPEDLKFWSGTSPAELRRLARERAARENQG